MARFHTLAEVILIFVAYSFAALGLISMSIQASTWYACPLRIDGHFDVGRLVVRAILRSVLPILFHSAGSGDYFCGGSSFGA